ATGLTAELGLGEFGGDHLGFTYVPATLNGSVFEATVDAGPLAEDLYSYVYRVSLNGTDYTYCDADQADPTTFDINDSGVLDVTKSTVVDPGEEITVTENFDNFTHSGNASSYVDGNFVGVNGITWNYVKARIAADSTSIDGRGMVFNGNAGESRLSATAIPGGISKFEVKIKKAFSGNGQIELFINDT